MIRKRYLAVLGALLLAAPAFAAQSRHSASGEMPAPEPATATSGHAKFKAAATCETSDPTRVTVANGAPICGKPSPGNSGIYSYLGIEYATAKRWQYSSVVPPGAQSATIPGAICPQYDPPPGSPPQNEQCLYLNIWTPSGAINARQSLPVMVFIHGGAFQTGQGSSGLYDGTALASIPPNAVVVTLNYRLGALGFLAANTGLGGVQAFGNYGIVDQQMALLWVQTYIKAFGGDPSRVTLFGESAGAMSVGLHLFDMPASKTLFKAAIMESNPGGTVYNTPAQETPAGNAFLTWLCEYKTGNKGCSRDWYYDAGLSSISTIVGAQHTFLYTGPGPSPRALVWAPLQDGIYVMGQPLAGYDTASNMPPKIFAFGINHDEGVLFGAKLLGGHSYVPLKSTYESTLNFEFGANTEGLVVNSTAPSMTSRYMISTGQYCWQQNPLKCYYSPWGQSFANVVTDYSFVAGNLQIAANAMTTGQRTLPIYAYLFAQPPAFDEYGWNNGDKGACMPSTGNVCHANELPYVFNTLGVYLPNLPAGDPNQHLADLMTVAWSQFAQNPASPGAAWTTFSNGSGFMQWDGTGTPITALPWNANTDFWNTNVFGTPKKN